ncbi:MAG: hypothetical protein ACP5D2_02405 [Candidatus Nanoarchaeia archaeon]
MEINKIFRYLFVVVMLIFLSSFVFSQVSNSSNYVMDSFDASSGGQAYSDNYTSDVYTGLAGDTNSSTYSTSLGMYAGELDSCLEQCSEQADCQINENCYLYSSLCSDDVCDFGNFTLNASIYTTYTGSDARNLSLNISGENYFLEGSQIVFSGQAGKGGDAGRLEITSSYPNLFNTTNILLIGRGGNISSGVAGQGGEVVLNYWGLIRNFSDNYIHPGLPDNTPILTGGCNTTICEDDGSITYNQDEDAPVRDVDLNGDGRVSLEDVNMIKTNYNTQQGDVNWTTAQAYDIDKSDKVNVPDLARVGYEYHTR